MNWELWISLFALLVSILVALYSYIQGKKSNVLQERIVTLEEGREFDRKSTKSKAEIVPKITMGTSRTGKVKYLLSVFNNGESEARNIKVKILGKTPTEFSDILTEVDEIPFIAPENNFDFIVAKSGDTPTVWQVEVEWEDDFNTERYTRSTLKV